MDHLGKTIDDDEDGIKATLSTRKTDHKIHADICPWLSWNRQRHVQTGISRMAFGFLTGNAPFNKALHITP